MKNLENYGVQELNAKEIESVNGGWLWFPPNLFRVTGKYMFQA